MSRIYVALGSVIGGLLLLAVACSFFRNADPPTPDSRPEFEFQAIGPEFQFRPTITNVQIVDFHGKGKRADILVCDVQRNCVLLYERNSNGDWNETVLADGLMAPAHATLVDIDQDGDNDVVVSVMGNLHPDDGVIGSVVLLEQANGAFEAKTLLSDVRRVVDVQPADFDHDGDIDLAVAVFGYLRGQVLWLENLGDETFRDHELLSAPGAIHVPVADYDNDGDQDIAAVISQEEEEVWVFENRSPGEFKKRKVFQSINFDLGTAGLVQSDLDQDGDVDLLLPVGDNLEDRYSHGQPYHGCLWLENKGSLEFETHRLCHFPGTYAADVADLDNDGDKDVVLVSMTNDWDAPDGHSIVWLENDGQQSFRKHGVARQPIQLITVACGDINDDGRNDIVAGGLHVFRPYDRLGRISTWTNQLSSKQAARDEPATSDSQSVRKTQGPVPEPANLSVEDECTRRAILGMKSELEATVSQANDQLADWMKLGNLYFAYGFFDSAVACYEQGVRLDSESAEAKLHLGIALGRLGNLSEAHQSLTAATETANASIREVCWHELGRCCLRLERANEAESAFERAGSYPWSLLERAKLRVRSEEPSAALPFLDQLAESYPAAIEYFMLRARAYEAMGDLDEAARLRDMAEYNSRRLPTDAFTLQIETVRETVGLERLRREAMEHIRDKRWDEASQTLSLSASCGWNQQVYLLWASTELKRQNPDAAAKILTNLIADCGQFPESLLLLGDAHQAMGDADRARQVWEQLAAVRPGIGLHQRLANWHEQQGDPAKSRKNLAQSLQAQGIADLRNSKISLAAKTLESALKLDDSLATSWFYLGECLRMRGESLQARKAYEKCLTLDPSHGRSAEAIRRLPVP